MTFSRSSAVPEMGEDEGGFDGVADCASAGGEVAHRQPADGEQRTGQILDVA
ncbi:MULTISPECIES: hypothetical protein [Amycolatopsis]|uniref:hypothetical protein n=1 Tax=Amycolatopsis TaxID=1813 RepID=UPI001303FF19|nr:MULTISPECIES: hypothetical protein [Amycolatopsis]